jgi:hemoglobin-like flavoprotein
MELNVALLESSFRALALRADELATRFYDRLFSEHPELRTLFPDDMTRQKESLIATLVVIVQSLRKPDALRQTVHDLAIRHIDYGVVPEQYPVVGTTLVATLAELSGDTWNHELEEAWTLAYAAIQSMVYATLEDAPAS